jgi:beta-glucosidase
MSDGVPFPIRFLWGAGTSAYQIEGSPLADGAGPSIWHRFAHTPGMTANGETGDVACDHYRRAEQDVRLMRDLGLKAYRFSIAWARVLPAGRGRVNAPGLAFYDRLTDLLVTHDIRPVVTLYHWDLPGALEDEGGWLNRDVADWFAEYARIVVRALGDRVTLWVTLNEPWVVSDAGYLHGVYAPGTAIRLRLRWSATTCCAPTALACKRSAPRAGSRRARRQPRAEGCGLRPAGRRRRHASGRCIHEPAVPGCGVLRPLS